MGISAICIHNLLKSRVRWLMTGPTTRNIMKHQLLNYTFIHTHTHIYIYTHMHIHTQYTHYRLLHYFLKFMPSLRSGEAKPAQRAQHSTQQFDGQWQQRISTPHELGHVSSGLGHEFPRCFFLFSDFWAIC